MTNSLGEQQVAEGSLGGPYFVISAKGFRSFDPVPFNRMLNARYPGVFAQTPDATPVIVGIEQGATKTSDFLPAFFLGIMPQVLTCGLVGTVWESDWSKMDVSIEVSSGDEPATTVEVSASRQSHGLLNAGVARLFQWPSQGWHRPRGDLAGEEFEGLVNAVADALVATLAKMPPGQRAGLRRNPVALQRFQKKFPWGFGVQGLGVSEKVIHVYPAQPENGNAAPRTVGWAFDPATREGKIRADILGCDYAASTRWLLNREIPRRCRAEAGIGVSLLSIQNETLGADKVLEISFLVVE